MLTVLHQPHHAGDGAHGSGIAQPGGCMSRSCTVIARLRVTGFTGCPARWVCLREGVEAADPHKPEATRRSLWSCPGAPSTSSGQQHPTCTPISFPPAQQASPEAPEKSWAAALPCNHPPMGSAARLQPTCSCSGARRGGFGGEGWLETRDEHRGTEPWLLTTSPVQAHDPPSAQAPAGSQGDISNGKQEKISAKTPADWQAEAFLLHSTSAAQERCRRCRIRTGR